MSPIPSLFHPVRPIAAIALLLSCSVAFAVDVSNAWARATIKGQTASVVYMTVTSTESARLVGASSPLAAVVQVHEMAMQGTTMKMRPVAAVDLPAGQPVELKPGGLHVMLMDLRQPLSTGDKLPLTLRIEGPDHRIVEQAVSIDVRNAAPMMKPR
ncbi:MAG: copper chaperone PCu(A)C [Burkholderiaceae bacterium]